MVRGQSTPTWGPKNTYFRGTFPDSAGSSSCDPRIPLAGFCRPDREFGGVLWRFRAGVSIYVLDGFRLVLNSNRIKIETLGGSDRAARAHGPIAHTYGRLIKIIFGVVYGYSAEKKNQLSGG